MNITPTAFIALVAVALCGADRVTRSAPLSTVPTALTRRDPASSLASPAHLTDAGGPRMTDFAFRDQHSQIVEKRDLLGQIWIADFIYSSCQGACPLLTSRLLTLQRRLPDPRLRFVSFSVDPGRDNPTTLAQYAQRWKNTDPRWELLSTDPTGLKQLTSSMKLALEPNENEILHTNRFFLLDARGAVAGSFDSSDDDALERLLAAAAHLLGTTPEAVVNGSTGTELFASLGCAGCHSDSQLAPPLTGLFGSHVMLERGGNLTVDDAYVRESISTPAAKLVAGYPNSMPTYGSMLSPAQLDALVDYVRSLHGARMMAEQATRETDPVCGMPVRVSKGTPAAEYRGHSYHFCSLTCARHFQADPQKYLPAQ